MLRYVLLRCVALRCVVLCYILLHYIALHHVMLHYVVLCYSVLHCVLLHCVTLRYRWEHMNVQQTINLNCSMLCCVALHFVVVCYPVLCFAMHQCITKVRAELLSGNTPSPADRHFSMLTEWFSQQTIYFLLLCAYRWLFGEITCQLYAMCGVLFGLCSLTNLTALSSVCCLKVCFPNHGEDRQASRWKTATSIKHMTLTPLFCLAR